METNDKDSQPAAKALIEVAGLSVDYWSQDQWCNVVDRVAFEIGPGEALGLVGESGCGKTTVVYSMLNYRRPNSRIRQGHVYFQGRDLLQLSARALQHVRGRHISLVPQDPTTALSPGMHVGSQIAETLRTHGFSTSAEEARSRTLELFRLVSLPGPEKIQGRYPHQLSGGQQQRVIIAMALACGPDLVLLDEPTTGLDVTTQAQILDLLMNLRAQYNMAMLYVTHNLGVVAQICDRIGVMYAGHLVEIAPRRELFRSPRHPYTHGLIASVPRVTTPTRHQALLMRGLLRRSELPTGCPFAPRCEFAEPRCCEEPQPLFAIAPDHQVACWRWQDVPPFGERVAESTRTTAEQEETRLGEGVPLLQVKQLSAGYSFRRRGISLQRSPKVVVDRVSFDIRPGETFALVGESGSGKTTVARALTGLLPYTGGDLRFRDTYDLLVRVDRRPDELLRSLQLIFQNPDASLNPRQRVSQIIGRPLAKFFHLSGSRLRQQVERLLADVHLENSFYNRFPDELSGGERQRIALARALAAEPQLLLCDEILSALDVSVQANILRLLIDLQTSRGIAFLFVSHDLAVVRSLAHRVGVMYWGSLCEIGDVEDIFRPPFHPYTYLLLASVPEADPDQQMPAVRKDIGLLTEEPKTACPFAARCPWKVGGVCDETDPPWQQVSSTHRLRCHILIEELKQRLT
jgi:peptide/nickel transport system ATP-binding protein